MEVLGLIPDQLTCPGELLHFADERGLPWLVRQLDATGNERREWHLPAHERDEGLRACDETIAALEKMTRFVPEGAEGIPASVITSEVGRRILANEPSRFSTTRLSTRREVFITVRRALERALPPRTRDTNLDALFQQVLARPDDDDPRLVFADAIGATDPECAEFIVAQIELRRLERAGRPPDSTRVARANAHLTRFADVWSNGLRPLVTEFQFRRGFVERVELPAAHFPTHAEVLFQRAPIRHLTLTRVESGLPNALARPELQRIRLLELRGLSGTMALAMCAPLANVEVLDLRGVQRAVAPTLRWPALKKTLLPGDAPFELA